MSEQSIKPGWQQQEIDQLHNLVEKLLSELAELRKPVVVARTGEVEKVRAGLAMAREIKFNFPQTKVIVDTMIEKCDMLLSAYDALAADNAMWIRARDVWQAEMGALRERLEEREQIIDERNQQIQGLWDACTEYEKQVASAIFRGDEQHEIVARIWIQLGSPNRDELKGRSIYDLIAELQNQKHAYKPHTLGEMARQSPYRSELDDELEQP